MDIQLATSIGTGPTKLAAFDNALFNAGIANYNLIRLSSVIPPHSKIIRKNGPIVDIGGEWGDRLYVVMAEKRIDTPNAEAWAGIGWVQDPITKKGLFVEHEGNSEKAVRGDIEDSLVSLMKTRGIDFGEIHMKVVGAACEEHPVCAMAVAVYEPASWVNIKSLSK